MPLFSFKVVHSFVVFESIEHALIREFRLSGRFHCVAGQVVPDILKDRSAFIFVGQGGWVSLDCTSEDAGIIVCIFILGNHLCHFIIHKTTIKISWVVLQRLTGRQSSSLHHHLRDPPPAACPLDS